MDDDLVLNLVVDDIRPKKGQLNKKGGRWKERSILISLPQFLFYFLQVEAKSVVEEKGEDRRGILST